MVLYEGFEGLQAVWTGLHAHCRQQRDQMLFFVAIIFITYRILYVTFMHYRYICQCCTNSKSPFLFIFLYSG